MKKSYIRIITSFLLTLIIILSTLLYFNDKKEINKKSSIPRIEIDTSKITYNETEELIDLDYYRSVLNNNDLKGIIKIDGLLESYIMQSDDNDFYLSHQEDKEYNMLGSITLDYRVDLNDSKIKIIYGHNGYDRITPFHNLEKYYDEDFYKDNRYIKIHTEKENLLYEIFSVGLLTKKSNKHIKIDFASDDEYLNHLKWLKNISIYDTHVDVSKEDSILILQTCSHEYKDMFLIINARRVKNEEMH